jgi:hypothetical protein
VEERGEGRREGREGEMGGREGRRKERKGGSVRSKSINLPDGSFSVFPVYCDTPQG